MVKDACLFPKKKKKKKEKEKEKHSLKIKWLFYFILKKNKEEIGTLR